MLQYACCAPTNVCVLVMSQQALLCTCNSGYRTPCPARPTKARSPKVNGQIGAAAPQA